MSMVQMAECESRSPFSRILARSFLTLCLLFTSVSGAKTDGPINMPSGVLTRGAQETTNYMGSILPREMGTFGSHTWTCSRAICLTLFARSDSDVASGCLYCSNLIRNR